MLKRQKKGQTLVEYITIIIIVMGVFLAMGSYIKRGIQGRWKSVTDDLGDQYDPRVANGLIRHTLISNTSSEVIAVPFGGGGKNMSQRTDYSNVIEIKKGYTAVGSY